MANYFSIFLVTVTLVSGVIYFMDKCCWAKKRRQAFEDAKSQAKKPLSDEAKDSILQPSWLVENGVSIFPVIAFVLILRSFIFEPFQIPSGSMMPTLLIGDFLLVEKYAYGIKDPVFQSTLIETGKPKRGDIVVFRYPPDPNVNYIKRVIGLPGDTVRYTEDKTLCIQKSGSDECTIISKENEHDSEFIQDYYPLIQAEETLDDVKHDVLINRARLNQSAAYYENNNEWTVPEGHYFTMGDNRDNSADSRFWGFVPEENLVGRAFFIWISFEFERASDSLLPNWIPTGVRFNRIGGLYQ